MRSNRLWLAALAFSVGACGKGPPAEPPQSQGTAASTIAGRDWVLVSIDEQPAPLGAREQPVTLRLDSASGRAEGFGGCNRYSASYALRGDSLSFGSTVATKMFCSEGSDLERQFFEALAATTKYELSDSTLVLRTRTARVLKLRRG